MLGGDHAPVDEQLRRPAQRASLGEIHRQHVSARLQNGGPSGVVASALMVVLVVQFVILQPENVPTVDVALTDQHSVIIDTGAHRCVDAVGPVVNQWGDPGRETIGATMKPEVSPWSR